MSGGTTGLYEPITPDEINRIWRYDPDSGNFYWRIRPCNPIHVGDLAGEKTNEGYIRLSYQRRRYMAHWLVWTLVTGAWPTTLIDHKDNNGANNRPGNLREATPIANSANRKRWAKHTNLRGARFRPNRGNWTAVLDRKHLGTYPTEQEAHEAWKRAAVKHYGEFARFD